MSESNKESRCKDCNDGRWIAAGCHCHACGRKVPSRLVGQKVDLKKADWAALELEVVTKIRLLRGLAEKLEEGRMGDLIARDLILPCVKLLGEFCVAIEVSEARKPKG